MRLLFRDETTMDVRAVQRRSLLSRVYLPAFSIAAIAVALVVIGWFNRFGGAAFSDSMSSLRTIAIGPASLALIGVFLVAERVRPAQRRPLIARGHRQDFLYTILNATLVIPLVTALTLSFSEVARKTFPWIILPSGAVPIFLRFQAPERFPASSAGAGGKRLNPLPGPCGTL